MKRKLGITLLALLTFTFSGFTGEAKAATTPHEVKDIIVKTAVSMGVDPCVALSIAKHESEFQAQKKSPYGAVGVFQLMPSTARKIGVNPYLVSENIKGGIMYYQMMYKKFGSMDLALAAYNAGPGNVAKYNGVPPFRETKNFVSGIKNNYKTFQNDPAVLKHTKPASEVKKNDTTTKANKNNQAAVNTKTGANEPEKNKPETMTSKNNDKVLANSSVSNGVQDDKANLKTKKPEKKSATNQNMQNTQSQITL